MLAAFVNRILEIQRPVTVEVNGITYWTPEADNLDSGGLEVKPNGPHVLKFRTLTGLVDFRSKLTEVSGAAFYHVKSPAEVRLYTERTTERKARWHWATAILSIREFQFGHWERLEDFLIFVQALMVPTDDRARLLHLLGTVTDEEATTALDDGVTQRVTTRAGIHLKADNEQPVENPFNLAPFRTFPHLDQPVSPFILRVRGGADKMAMLVEADGGRWMQDAIEKVATEVSKLDPGIPVLA